jgi:hypothetical protein
MIAATRTALAWIFIGLMGLTLAGCNGKDREAAPLFTQQPGSLTVNEGAAANFTVAASPPSATIQWYRNGVPISGATATTYAIAVTTAADNGARFYAIATTKGGNATSSDAILTVRAAPPSIGTQPANATVNQGATATFSVTATGSNLSYQWQKNGTNIAGATSASYTTPATTGADTGALFRVVVTNTGGSVTSNAATLTVIVPPAITTQPASTSVAVGATATFTVAVSGTSPTFQWQKNGTNIAGATSASYTTPATVAGDDGAQFRVVVTNAAGAVTSTAATLGVVSAPVITTQPANQSVNTGATATFTVVATGTNLTYQWQKNGTNVGGATGSSYTTPATVAGDDGAAFRVVVTNLGGSVTSNAATLTVTNPTPPATFRTTPMISDHASGGAALKADGTVWAWGLGNNGENGNGVQDIAASPVQVMIDATTPLTRIVKISAGASHVLALDDQGQVWVWGGELSLGSQNPTGGTISSFAQRVLTDATGTAYLTNVTDIAAGRGVSYAALADGTVVGWGGTEFGAMGNGSTAAGVQAFPLPIPGVSGVVEVSAGDFRGFARTSNGTIYAWGNNGAGAIGNGSFAAQPSAVTVSGISSAVRVAAADETTMAILADGTARLWGQHNYVGQPACGTPAGGTAVPTTVPLPSGGTTSTYTMVAPVSAANAFVYGAALYQTGDPLGDGVDGGCSTGTLLQTAGLTNVVGVARSFGRFTHVWTSDGRVFAAGTNDFGQLGVGNRNVTAAFTEIPGFNLLGSTNAGTQVFFTDFESGLVSQVAAGSGASIVGVQQFAGLGATGNQFAGSFLRSATGNVVTVTLTNLPTHSAISLQFLFAAIDSLDGAGAFPAGDYFKITMDGNEIFREAFANATPTQVQTYLPPPGVELARRVDLGFTGPGSFYTDSAYDLGRDPQFVRIPHTGSSVTFTFQIEGAGIQDLNDESWAMDNLKISVVP